MSDLQPAYTSASGRGPGGPIGPRGVIPTDLEDRIIAEIWALLDLPLDPRLGRAHQAVALGQLVDRIERWRIPVLAEAGRSLPGD